MSAHTLLEQWHMLDAGEFVLVWLRDGVRRRDLWRWGHTHTDDSCISHTHPLICIYYTRHVHTHMHSHAHAHALTHTHTHMHTHTHTHTHLHTHLHMHTRTIHTHYMIYICVYHRLTELSGAAVYDPCLTNPCKNGGHCSMGNNDTYTCDCLKNYYGNECDGKCHVYAMWIFIL